jgi:hypothetical protein
LKLNRHLRNALLPGLPRQVPAGAFRLKEKIMKRTILGLLVLIVSIGGVACNYAEEQGTVSVEVTQGKIVKVHEPGETYTTFGPYTTGYEVDLRNHVDGVDIQGVTTDNARFYMKINVVYKPLHTPNAPLDQDPLVRYLSSFGLDDNERSVRRWGVLKQLVGNAGRLAVNGRYNAYELLANQDKVLNDIKADLDPKFKNEMFCEISSVGMDIAPQFADSKIDEAANAVVAAKKQKDAEQAWKEAAQIRLEKQQIENQVWNSSPQAFELEKLKWQAGMIRDFSQGIAQHQGTLILDPSAMRQLQLQTPLQSGSK